MCWVLLGPTASGKTKVSLELARRHRVELVSVDSMQVYRGMDIGTAKPSLDERRQAVHHLIDVAEPEESFSAGRFCRLAEHAIKQILARGNQPLLLCGTPLYLKALLWGLFEGPPADVRFREQLRRQAQMLGAAHLHRRLAEVDPEAASRISENDMRRIERALEVYELTGKPISAQQGQFAGPPRRRHAGVGLSWPREVLYQRIERRVDDMMAEGLLEEVRSLAPRLGPQARQAVGYKELLAHLEGGGSLEGAVELIKRNSRRLAKHQLTWFRHFPGIRWVEVSGAMSFEGIAGQCEFNFTEGLDHLVDIRYH